MHTQLLNMFTITSCGREGIENYTMPQQGTPALKE